MSKKAQILELAKQGLRPSEIAKQLDVTQSYATSTTCAARKEGMDLPKFMNPPPRSIIQRMYLPNRKKLAAEAKKRGLTEADLAVKLLNTVAADDLFAAVLEDE